MTASTSLSPPAPRLYTLLVNIPAALCLILIPLALHFGLAPAIGPFQTKIMIDVGIAIILAVSLNVVNGFAGQFSIGHAGFMAIGAYVAAFVVYYGSLWMWGSAARQPGFLVAGEWLLVLGCFLGALVAAGLGYIVGLPSLRLRGDYLAIVTLGFGEIIRVLLQQTGPQLNTAEELANATWSDWFPPPLGGSLGFALPPRYATPFWVYLFVGVTLLVAFRLKTSSLGRALLSIREDEIAARSMGVDIARYKVRAFVLAAFFAGIAGGLFAHSGVNLSPRDAGFLRSFEIVIMVVLGGMGSISGATLAAILLTTLPELLRGLEQYRLIAYALLLVIMMILRPQGLFGIYEIWDIFRRPRAAKPHGGSQ